MFLKVHFSIPWIEWEVIDTEKEGSFWKDCRIHIRMKWKEYDFWCWFWIIFFFWNNRNIFDCMSTLLEKSAHFHGIIGHYIPDCTNPTHEDTLEYPAHIAVVINDIDEDIYWNSWKTSNLFVRLKIFSLIYKRVNSLRKFFSSLSFLFLKIFWSFYFHVVILLPLRKMQIFLFYGWIATLRSRWRKILLYYVLTFFWYYSRHRRHITHDRSPWDMTRIWCFCFSDTSLSCFYREFTRNMDSSSSHRCERVTFWICRYGWAISLSWSSEGQWSRWEDGTQSSWPWKRKPHEGNTVWRW